MTIIENTTIIIVTLSMCMYLACIDNFKNNIYGTKIKNTIHW